MPQTPNADAVRLVKPYVEQLVKGLTDEIAALKTRVAALEAANS